MINKRTAADLKGHTAMVLEDLLRPALATKPRASIAVSGGSTPWPALEMLAEAELDWERVDVYQVDERVAPDGDPDRNLTHLRESFTDRVPVQLHPMPVGAADLDEGAFRYAWSLPRRIDVVHLGLGIDGHTASLIPGDPVLEERERDVAITGVYGGHRRMTLTYPAINRAAARVWLVTDDSKREVLDKLLAGDRDIPAGMISNENAILITDIGLFGSK